MGHKHETQAHSDTVPRHQHVFRRGSTWYYRRRIPDDLIAAGFYGKQQEFKESMKTSDSRAANAAASRRDVLLDAEFEEKRRGLAGRAENGPRAKDGDPTPITRLSGMERKELVLKWFVHEEQAAEQTRREYSTRDPELAKKRDHLIDSLIDELTALGSFHGTNFWEQSFKVWLKEQGLKFEPGEAANELESWLRRARAETATRTLRHLQGKPAAEIDGLFSGVSSISQLSSAKSASRVTIGELCEKFMADKRSEGTRPSTLKSYNLPIQVLKDLFSPRRPISEFEYTDGERIIEFLATVPVHADKHYPRHSLVEAAAAESRTHAHGVLSAKRQSDVFTVIRSIFENAVGKGWLTKNPLGAKALARKLPAVTDSKRIQMTGDELKRLLSSREFLKERERQGPSGVPHQGRFWAVLLLLLHGLRANEAAQLFVSDVKESDGIAYLDVTETDDSGNIVKNLKTKTSKRRVPLHKEILRIGFLEFVQAQRQRHPNERLFQEFKANNIGNYAASLSKWFSRLRDNVFGEQKKMGDKSLHSLRHGVTDAVRRVTESDEIRYELCGHSDGKEKNSGARYGTGFPLRKLKEVVDKIEFDELNLAFLYPAPIAGDSA